LIRVKVIYIFIKTEKMTTQTEERKFTLTEIMSAWYECYGESLEDDYYGFIQTLKDPTWEEPCDRCPSQSMSWCQSNGCPRESEDEEEEVDSFIYNSYKCKHSDCDYETLNTNPDCIKCGKECCMLAQSNEGSSEYEIECCYEAEHGGGISNSFKSKEEAMEEFERVTNYDKEDQYHVVYLNERLLDKHGNIYDSDEIKVWRKDSPDDGIQYCEVGEHYVSNGLMWPDFGDCQECCSEKEYLERTGGTKTKKIKFNVKK